MFAFRASKESLAEDFAPPEAPWSSAACPNCSFWHTERLHAAFIHVQKVHAGWRRPSEGGDFDRCCSFTTSLTVAVCRALTDGKGSHLHILRLGKDDGIVDLTRHSPLWRESWVSDWALCCGCNLDYVKHWGAELDEVILDRSELESFSACTVEDVAQQLDEDLQSRCAAWTELSGLNKAKLERDLFAVLVA
jgi:hypothetical protein